MDKKKGSRASKADKALVDGQISFFDIERIKSEKSRKKSDEKPENDIKEPEIEDQNESKVQKSLFDF